MVDHNHCCLQPPVHVDVAILGEFLSELGSKFRVARWREVAQSVLHLVLCGLIMAVGDHVKVKVIIEVLSKANVGVRLK